MIRLIWLLPIALLLSCSCVYAGGQGCPPDRCSSSAQRARKIEYDRNGDRVAISLDCTDSLPDPAAAGRAVIACESNTLQQSVNGSGYSPFGGGGGGGDITQVGNCASGSCFTSEAQNLFLAAPSSSTGQMSPRLITDADVPNSITITQAQSAVTAIAALGPVGSTPCTAGQYATDVQALFAMDCSQVQFSELGGQATLSQLPSLPDDTTWVGSSGGVPTNELIPDCLNNPGALWWATGSNQWTCLDLVLGFDTIGLYVADATANGGLVRSGTEGSTLGLRMDCASGELLKWNGTSWACASDDSGSAVGFASITGGENTSAAMLCGTGCSIAPNGTGQITATDTDCAAGEVKFGDGSCAVPAPAGITSINGESGPAITLAVDNLGSLFEWNESAGTITLSIPFADGSNRGILSAGGQEIGGQKEMQANFVLDSTFQVSRQAPVVNDIADSITVTGVVVEFINNAGDFVLTSTPQITGGATGSFMVLVNDNVSTGSVGFQDDDIEAGSLVETHNDATMTLQPGEGVVMFKNLFGNWVQVTPTSAETGSGSVSIMQDENGDVPVGLTDWTTLKIDSTLEVTAEDANTATIGVNSTFKPAYTSSELEGFGALTIDGADQDVDQDLNAINNHQFTEAGNPVRRYTRYDLVARDFDVDGAQQRFRVRDGVAVSSRAQSEVPLGTCNSLKEVIVWTANASNDNLGTGLPNGDNILVAMSKGGVDSSTLCTLATDGDDWQVTCPSPPAYSWTNTDLMGVSIDCPSCADPTFLLDVYVTFVCE